MPLHDLHEVALRFNFMIAEVENTCILLHLLQSGRENPDLSISRQPQGFTITLRWMVAHRLRLSLHPSLEEAMAAYEVWLRADVGAVRIADDPSMPQWVNDVPLVITLDMMRSNWEIAHDYADVAALADELGKFCPRETMFYLPGTNGAYDSAYPGHGPHDELGGEERFREMIRALHRNGFKIMLHANAWGVDPCHDEIEHYLPYLLKDDNDGYEGWQTGGTIWGGLTLPSSYKLKFRTGRIPVVLKGPASGRGTFLTLPIPDECEAMITFGTSYSGSGRIRLSTNHRSYLSPRGWFSELSNHPGTREHGEYAFPFPFLLTSGENPFTVELVDDSGEELADCWYQIRDAFTFVLVCTYPILRADTTNEEWIRIIVDEITKVVKQFDIDAVHVDATHYHRDAPILEALRREIPDCAISLEELETMDDLRVGAFCQNARLEMLSDLTSRRLREARRYLPDQHYLHEASEWLNQPSPVWRHLRQYVRLYPHLCDADGFVPTAKVCNIRPPALVPKSNAKLHQILEDSDRLGYIPGIRLNYRDYGLDNESRKAIEAIARRSAQRDNRESI